MAQHYRDTLQKMIEPIIESEGFELVDLECLRGKARWLIRIYLDNERGVTVDDCAHISNEIGDVLSVYDIPPGPYDLEVSSPGLDRPLTRDKDFVKYKGHTVKIRTGEKVEGRRNFRGVLEEYYEEGGEHVLIVNVEGKECRIPRRAIIKANLQYDL